MPPLPPRVRGAGWNRDTQQCIAALVELFEPGMSVLDLGCGSGLIAIIAKLMGADPVYATEFQPLKLAFAQSVIKLNGLTISVLPSHVDLPRVNICVANVGSDYVWEIKKTIKADKIITADNETGNFVILHA